VALFYWLFDSEKPIQRIFEDTDVLVSYVIVGIGTPVYIVYWVGLIMKYPESKLETLPSGYGLSLRMFSLGGIWLAFVLCHVFGAFIALWAIASGVKKILVRATRLRGSQAV
jgi:hypothetical protein